MKRRIARLGLATVSALVLGTAAAHAESCSRSRDFLLTQASDLPENPRVYRALFRDCMATLELSNVQDAFILKVGAIAVVPKRDTLAATAATLAQFCERFPRGTLHFIKRRDKSRTASISRAVRMTAARPTPCAAIVSGG